MPSYEVVTGGHRYEAVVERGVLSRLSSFIPLSSGKIFVTTTDDVWQLWGDRVSAGLSSRDHKILFFPRGEENKRFSSVEALAEEMVRAGGDRTSIVIALGGGIVNDMSGFLAAIFMRGIPVIQIPTTLLAQVDAAVGGKTGVNLPVGKNLIGSFHQPQAVLVDPEVLRTLPEREYRAGLYEIIKHGVIASPELFRVMTESRDAVLSQESGVVDYMISESVRIKAEVVTADEKESDLRRILNFGHTVGHALEAETGYKRLLHGEAVAFGMRAATLLSAKLGILGSGDCAAILKTVEMYGPIPSLDGVTADALGGRLSSDKKTVKGKVHFVFPDRIGHTVIRSGVDSAPILESIREALG